MSSHVGFEGEALWNKSKTFVGRAIDARNRDEPDQFVLWASLSLELLGKSILARTHPTLVADPSHFGSLLAACGMPRSVTRTITAKTTYDRLPAVVKAFDEKAKKSAMLMANLRNEELHTGASPSEGRDPRAWVPEFWRVCSILVKARECELSDWLAPDEAVSVQKVLDDSSQLLSETVSSRIGACRQGFDASYPPGSAARTQRVKDIGRACQCVGPLAGGPRRPRSRCAPALSRRVHVRVGWPDRSGLVRLVNPEFDGDGFYALATVTCLSEAFQCAGCGLTLKSRDEIEVTNLVEEFEVAEEVEPDWADEYGND